MNDIRVSFETNIDFYHDREYPKYLPFRPMIGDLVPFIGQEKHFLKYPFLEITNIAYRVNELGKIDLLFCNLWFNENTHSDIRHKILNHESL